jgi:hypothetical protein
MFYPRPVVNCGHSLQVNAKQRSIGQMAHDHPPTRGCSVSSDMSTEMLALGFLGGGGRGGESIL